MAIIIIASVLSAICAYLMGSINSAILVSRIYAREDIRKHGSGNAGMTNILRTYGKIPAFFTFLGDFSKGILAVLVGRLLFYILGVTAFDGGYIAGFFALLGHLFPLYFNFKGGKGVLTSLGVVLMLNPKAFLLVIAVGVPLVFIVKIVSLASIVGAVLFPIFTFLLGGVKSWPDILFALLISGTIIWMHRANIKRLLNGTEHKFGTPKTKPEAAPHQNKQK